MKTKNIARSSSNFYDQIFQHLGTGGGTKTDEFSEKYQTAFDLPPSFSEIYIAFFLRKSLFKALYKGPKFIRFGTATRP